MPAPKPQIGFAGLGAMGGGMAKHLLQSGYTVKGYDLSPPLVEAFSAAGGLPASTPSACAADTQFFISMVATAAQNLALLFDGGGGNSLAQTLPLNSFFILCSTTPPSFPTDLRQRLDDVQRQDVRLLDCPVSGGTLRAANGTLSIFAAGEEEDLDAARDVLDCLAEHLYPMGALGNGTKTKTIHQLLAATNIISAAEAMGLAASVGLNTPVVYEHVCGSDGGSFMFANRVPHMLESDWTPSSALGIILKDAGIVTAAAREIGYPTPLAATAETMYIQGQRTGLVKDDDARLVQIYLPPQQGDLVKAMTVVDTKMTASHQVSKETIADLLAGIHLAASVECMGFCRALGMEERVLEGIIKKAAGQNAMFDRWVGEAGGKWSLREGGEVDTVKARLADAVRKCQIIGYPCPMASVALQMFCFAGLEGKVVKRQDHGAR